MSDYQRIADVIRYLDENHTKQPDLESLAAHVGLSPHHFHRLFSRWAGVTPKDFLQCLTLTHAKSSLRNGTSVLDTSLDVGLSGPGRLHDLCVSLEAASPGEVKSRGTGWKITAGFADSPFGICLAAESPRGICHLSFVDARDRVTAEAEISRDWSNASLVWDDSLAESLVARMFRSNEPDAAPTSLRAIVAGTPFQVRVWRALLAVQHGGVTSYGRIADAIGMPQAARAVGSAVAANSLAYLIPCHRVIRETGVLGEYRWDPIRKRALLAWEGSVGRDAVEPRDSKAANW